MNRISQRFSQWYSKYSDTAARQSPPLVCVVGSGYGGSVAALRFIQLGYRVIIMERGSEFVPGEFPADIASLPTFLRVKNPTAEGVLGRSAGVISWHVGPGMAAMVGNGLGGGSLINAGILMRPLDQVFAQPHWPSAISKTADDDQHSLNTAFDSANKGLLTRRDGTRIDGKVDSRGLSKSLAFKDMAEQLGYESKLKPVHATIDPDRCISCGDCMSGCNVDGAKLTLTENYLDLSHQLGATILTGATVTTIQPTSEDGWRLSILSTELTDASGGYEQKNECQIDTGVVVLAAGAFGSTEILQRSQSRHQLPLSPALGTRLSANGDSISVLANYPHAVGVNTPTSVNSVNRTRYGAAPYRIGPTITQVLDLRTDGPLESQLIVEDAAVPAAMARAYDALISTQWATLGLDRWRTPKLVASQGQFGPTDPLGAPSSLGDSSQILLTMGNDGSAGRIVWMNDANGSIPLWDKPQSTPAYRAQNALFKKMNKTFKHSRHLHNPLWQLLPESAGIMQGGAPDAMITTVHPLGGCIMAETFDTGVVDDRCRVWRAKDKFHSGLFVMDGAVVPTALGCNPLLTITALAERAMTFVPRVAARPEPLAPHALQRDQGSPQPQQQPQATVIQGKPVIGAVFFERLFHPALVLNKKLSTSLSLASGKADAELVLGFAHHDWDSALAQAEHRLSEISGTLKLKSHGGEETLTYRLPERESPDSEFRILSDFDNAKHVNSWFKRMTRLFPVFLTWLIKRGIPDWRRQRTVAQISPTTYLHKEAIPDDTFTFRNARNLLKLFWHSTQVRRMRYRLHFEYQRNSGAPRRETPMPDLWVTGTKRVQYSATMWEIARFIFGQLHGRIKAALMPAHQWHRSRLKRSYLEQISSPIIGIHLAPPPTGFAAYFSKPLACARFIADPYSVAQDKPPQLSETGDLTTALATLAGYPALFLRYAAETQLFEFRAPDYSGQAYRDNAPRGETDLFNRKDQDGQRVLPAQVYPLQVARGRHASEDTGTEEERIDLRLWRYRARAIPGNTGERPDEETLPQVDNGQWQGQDVRRVRSILLLHAFSQSGLTYTFNTTSKNLAEAFIEAGYEVWLLESRMSTRLGYSDRSSTVDQMAQNDIPGAINTIVSTLGDDFKRSGITSPEMPFQIACFAQCIGSASLAMAQVSGRLNHPKNPRQSQSVPLLWATMFSQVHPIVVGARESQAKTKIPPMLQHVIDVVPFAVRAPVESTMERWADRVFASLPVPAEEQCPEEHDYSTHEDNVATCRRIRFIEAPLFKHRNVNKATHAILNRLFGNANVTLFAHARRFVDYELLVDEEGNNRYFTSNNIRQHMVTPMAFMHGAVNELFDANSAQRSFDMLKRLQPYWTASFSDGPIIIDDHGHIDVLIGDKAPDLVYPRIIGFFDDVLARTEQNDARNPVERQADPEDLPEIRYPQVGPMLGWTRWSGDGKHLLVRAVFVVQMSSRTAIDAGESGTSAWAYLPGTTPQALGITQFDGRVSIASGDIKIDAHRVNNCNGDLIVRLAVMHEQNEQPRTSLSRKLLVRSMWRQRTKLWQRRAAMDQPIAATRSRRWRSTQGDASSFAGDEAMWRRPVVVRRKTIDALTSGSASLTLAVGCCRYPNSGFDHQRADESLGKILDLFASGPQNVTMGPESSSLLAQEQASIAPKTDSHDFDAPAMALMLGDQIYADATAGLADPLTAAERYAERYHDAWRTGISPRLARLLRTLPVLMTPDDHEYRNGWPHDGDIADQGDSKATLQTAIAMLTAYQSMSNPLARRGSYFVDVGDCRMCIIDTRSFRELAGQQNAKTTIIEASTLIELKQWLSSAGDRFVFLFTGSVFLPRLRQDGSPSNPVTAPEGFDIAPEQRNTVLDMCIDWVPGRFALVSGDYHIGACTELRIAGRSAPVGCAIVTPPLYAPMRYINAQAYELICDDAIDTGKHRIELSPASQGMNPSGVYNGSGYALLTAERQSTSWRIKVGMQLNEYEAFSGWRKLESIATINF